MSIAYDAYRLNQTMLLDLQLREGTGSGVVHDWSPYPSAPGVLTGAPTWAYIASGVSYLTFDPTNPDRIVFDQASVVDIPLDPGSDFSCAVWIAPDAYGNRYLFDRSSATAGWSFWISATSPYLAFTTYNAGPASQTTYGGTGLSLTAGWQLVGFTRSSGIVSVFLNGVDVTTTHATHINPGDNNAIDLTIGTIVGAGAGWYDGAMWRPRIWGRWLYPGEMLMLYLSEYYNVIGV
jgi:hypothetical protein